VTARRVLLHCAAVRLPAVAGGPSLSLADEPPADFVDAWRLLGGGDETLADAARL
jgi:hypothetical protein